ncbi:TPM domain-containing protein [Gramella jeungdoensis]|uniref:TPM domain-containing protein n=1 Tax=Gramella jeungdoensis TaxID=708091 RepID=A0ABT0YYJ3_9FLAO|nr:TPM domain-containing protein [Gramella jeungdoensis]MCM8568538.1 TPM domain-containing protein [Gramella jeungdoensis]
MKIYKCLILILFIVSLIPFKATAQIDRVLETGIVEFEGEYALPASVGHVNDFEGILSFNQIMDLEKIISDYEKETTREIAVITVESIGPFDHITEYASDRSKHGPVGNPDGNNGLTIVISCTLQKIRISADYGTEQVLTNEICNRIIDDVMIPELKKGNYYSGIEKGVLELIKNWE